MRAPRPGPGRHRADTGTACVGRPALYHCQLWPPPKDTPRDPNCPLRSCSRAGLLSSAERCSPSSPEGQADHWDLSAHLPTPFSPQLLAKPPGRPRFWAAKQAPQGSGRGSTHSAACGATSYVLREARVLGSDVPGGGEHLAEQWWGGHRVPGKSVVVRRSQSASRGLSPRGPEGLTACQASFPAPQPCSPGDSACPCWHQFMAASSRKPA